jgi:hypothetical protein
MDRKETFLGEVRSIRPDPALLRRKAECGAGF